MALLSIDVPNVLVPRVVEAMRAAYPTLTDGLTDAQAGRAVIRHMVRMMVVAHETGQVRQQADEHAAAAEQGAWQGTEEIT